MDVDIVPIKARDFDIGPDSFVGYTTEDFDCDLIAGFELSVRSFDVLDEDIVIDFSLLLLDVKKFLTSNVIVFTNKFDIYSS